MPYKIENIQYGFINLPDQGLFIDDKTNLSETEFVNLMSEKLQELGIKKCNLEFKNEEENTIIENKINSKLKK